MQQIRLVVHETETAAEVVLNGRPAWRLGLAVCLLPVDRDNDRAEAREVSMPCIFPAPRRKGKATGWQWLWFKKKDHQPSNQGLPIRGHCYAM